VKIPAAALFFIPFRALAYSI